MFTVWWIALCNVHSCVNSKAGSLSNDDEILISRNSRSVRQVALKVCQGSKNAMTALNSKCKYENIAVFVRFPQTTQYLVFCVLWYFCVQRTTKKCTKLYHASTVCSLNILLGGVLDAVVAVVCLGSLACNRQSPETALTFVEGFYNMFFLEFNYRRLGKKLLLTQPRF